MIDGCRDSKGKRELVGQLSQGMRQNGSLCAATMMKSCIDPPTRRVLLAGAYHSVRTKSTERVCVIGKKEARLLRTILDIQRSCNDRNTKVEKCERRPTRPAPWRLTLHHTEQGRVGPKTGQSHHSHILHARQPTMLGTEMRTDQSHNADHVPNIAYKYTIQGNTLQATGGADFRRDCL